MGESIAEGTIVRWIKKVGDSVDRDEPLFEISTDKVDAEIPSPAAGTLLEISVKEGETVPVNSVVATIGAAGEGWRGCRRQPQRRPPRPAATHASQADGTPTARPPPPARVQRRGTGTDVPPQPQPAARSWTHATAQRPTAAPTRRQKSSPLVRRIAKEHGVDSRQITGYGHRRPRHEAATSSATSIAAARRAAARRHPQRTAAPAHPRRSRRGARAPRPKSCRCR